MVSGHICMAHGSVASVRAGYIPVVPSVAAGVLAVGLDGADHHLDSEHHPHVLRLALARDWSALVRSGLDYAVGIRVRGNGRCNYHVSPVHTTGGNPMFNRLAAPCECGLQTCVTASVAA